jgi:hypothetical protein
MGVTLRQSAISIILCKKPGFRLASIWKNNFTGHSMVVATDADTIDITGLLIICAGNQHNSQKLKHQPCVT